MSQIFSRNSFLLVTLILGSVLYSANVEVTVDTTWPVGTHTYDDITIRAGATLTLECDTTAGTGSTINANNIIIESGASISSNFQGYPYGFGPGVSGIGDGGAGHGGEGGMKSPTVGGPVYGSATQPITLGSGGSHLGGLSGAGGGAIRLIVSGAMTIDGTLSVNGEAVSSGNNGGGAGGSIYITTDSISGLGSMTANGGSGFWTGGGGGGRIAVYSNTNSFTGTARVDGGGSGSVQGQPGTVAFFDTSTPAELDIYTGHSYRFQTTDASGSQISYRNISLLDSIVYMEDSVDLVVTGTLALSQSAPENDCFLNLYAPQGTMTITAVNITVDAGCSISVNEKGHPDRSGPGTTSQDEGGAGHGGKGGSEQNGGPTYGSATEPVTHGSGGRHPTGTAGSGGGGMRLIISGSLTVNGTLSANGQGYVSNGHDGGGSGGSIYITTDTVSGSGSITADGGPGYWISGGGGGRIAIYYQTNSFSGTALVNGGSGDGGVYGQPGTVAFFDTSIPGHIDIYPGHSYRFQQSDATGSQINYRNINLLDSIVYMEDGVELVATDTLTLSQSAPENDCFLNLYASQGTMTITSVNVTVDAGCKIGVDEKGYPDRSGPGTTSHSDGGAGHGGKGGSEINGGPIYGSATDPVTLGSGGRHPTGTAGSGGGAMRLFISGSLMVNGTLSANGQGYVSSGHDGGGSGGSIYVTTDTVSGSGSITANGGPGYWIGGGGGGRIAIYYETNSFSGTARVNGGSGNGGANYGQPGTVAFFDASTPGELDLYTGHSYRFQANDATNSIIEFQNIILNDTGAEVESGLTISAVDQFQLLNTSSGTTLTPQEALSPLSLSSMDMLIQDGCTITVKGLGYATGQGPGTIVGDAVAGSGHGGAGGDPVTGGKGGPTYGSAYHPTHFGSGGGITDGTPGGGVVSIEVTGTLTVNGLITADSATYWHGQGSGSGGSILLKSFEIEGSGSITADGSSTSTGNTGGGGGGRIAIFFGLNTFTGVATADGGVHLGQDGTVWWLREIPISMGDTLLVESHSMIHNVFRLDWPGSSRDDILLRVTPQSAGGEWSLTGSYAEIHSEGEQEWTASRIPGATPTLEMVVPLQTAGPYYFDLINRLYPVGVTSFQIECIDVDRHLIPLPLGEGDVSGSLTSQLKGAGFEAGMQVALSNSGGGTIRSYSVTDENSTSFNITMDLTGLTPQVTDVAVIWPDSYEELIPDGLTLISGNPGMLVIDLDFPSVMRPLRKYSGRISLTNTGGSDVLAPVLQLKCVQDLAIRGRMEDPFERRGMLFLASPDIGDPRLIPPGTSFSIPFQFISEGAAHDPIQFEVYQVPETTEPGVWNTIQSSARPEYLAPEAWSTIWDNYVLTVGDSWQEFDSALRDISLYLSHHRHDQSALPTRDVRRLLHLIFTSASAGVGKSSQEPFAIDVVGTDHYLPLTFARYLPNTLNTRYQEKSMGKGWAHSFDVSLTSSPEAVNISFPAGYVRRFILSPLGEWQSTHNDFGVLADDVGGGYTLTDNGKVHYLFDTDGKLVDVSDNNGHHLTLTYDPSDQLIQVQHTNGQSISLSYSAGRLSSVTDWGGRIVSYQYSGDHLSSVTLPSSAVTHYGYTTDHALETITYPNGSVTHYVYDSQGRISENSINTTEEVLSFSYPDLGAFVVQDAGNSVYNIHYGCEGEVLSFMGPLNEFSGFSWTGHQRPYRFNLPDGNQLNFEWDLAGYPTLRFDQLGHAMRVSFDQDFGELDWLLDPRWNKVNHVLDANGNITGVVYPDGSTDSYTRDAFGRMTGFTNRRGQTITVDYNAKGQADTKTDTSTGLIFEATFDTLDRLQTTTSPLGSNTFTYNDLDQLTEVTNANGHGVTYLYGLSGERTRLTTDDGLIINYSYDAAGRLEFIRGGSNQLIVQYTYDDVGLVSGEIRGNASYSAYAYDLDHRLSSITHYAPDDSILADFSYTYDPMGRCLTETSIEGVTSFTYDPVGQLIDVNYPDGTFEHFSYDAAGNRTIHSDDNGANSYIVNTLNQYTHVGTEELQYDTDGNLTLETQRTYSYDSENRLLEVMDAVTGTETNTYDFIGKRVQTNSTSFSYDPHGLASIIAEYDGSDTTQAWYVYGYGLSARIEPSGTISYYGFDSRGHTRIMTDQSGAVTNRYDYKAFGSIRSKVEAFNNRFKYGAAYGVTTDDSGMMNMRARVYHPELGRFLSPDPAGVLAGPNLYTYASNDPININDPTGLINNSQSLYEDYGVERLYSKEKHAEIIVGGFGAGASGIFGAANAMARGAYVVVRGLVHAPLKTEAWHWVKRKIWGDDPPQTPEWKKNVVKYAVGGDGPNGDDGPDDGSGGGEDSANNTGYDLSGVDWDTLKSLKKGTNREPNDPNEKTGVEGIGSNHVITADQQLAYTVYFENIASASAPAQEVFVSDILDMDLDWSTLELTEIAWGDHLVSIPGGRKSFSTQVTVPDHREGVNQSWLVDIDVTFDEVTGQIDWTFRTLDPATLDLPYDALAGFLPPNDDTFRGEGHVSLSISLKPDTYYGTVILNSADIIFDTNPAISTNEVRNVIGILEFMSVLDQWLVGSLCFDQNPTVLEYVQFVNNAFTCED